MKTKVGEWHGFTVYLNRQKPKTKRGEERIWTSLQKGKKDWRMSQILAYVSGADILYVKNPNLDTTAS